ncbi:MAG: hypothetical protein COB98_00070 [Flavobacteriaceae bacterium]|nr:MAG: hypothetical protein COB98_00070 [Flavobacteriaceae bacterium]
MTKLTKILTKNKENISNLNHCNLSIQLSLDGFSFCITKPYSPEIICLEQYKFAQKPSNPFEHLTFTESLIQSVPILQQPFSTVKVCHTNNLASLVPLSLFDKERLSDYLDYNIRVLANDFITHDTIKHTDIVNVYVPFVNFNNFILEKYGSFNYKHSATVFIQSILKHAKNTSNNQVFVALEHGSMEIIVLKNNSLQLYNSFTITCKEDFIYYILFTTEQLQLNPEIFELVLLGTIHEEDPYFELCKTYVRHVSLINMSNINQPLLDTESKQANFNLIHLHECV